MKKVLVTGAAGAIGINVIKYLLSEGKYEITALDLRTKNVQKRLKRYRRRINLIYGDINDKVLMDALVKDQDYIIHLAGVLPPIADVKKILNEKVEVSGTENIINAINSYNTKCTLVYASSTTIYGDIPEASVNSKEDIIDIDYYSMSKHTTEKLIKDNLKNYTIIRVPLVLTNPKNNSFMYNVKLKTVVEPITDNDAGYLFATSIKHMDKLNKKVFNAGGGEEMQITYSKLLAKVLEIYGLSFKYLLTMLFVDKNFYSHIYLDSDKLNDIIEFRSDSLSSYYMRLKRGVKGRTIAKILAKPVVYILRKKSK